MSQFIIDKIKRCKGFFEVDYGTDKAEEIVNRALEIFEIEKVKMPLLKSKSNQGFMAFMDFMVFIYKALLEKEEKEKALELCKDCINYSIDIDFLDENMKKAWKDHDLIRAKRKQIIDDVNQADEKFGWIYKNAKYDEGILYSFDITRCGMYDLCRLFEVEELMPSICQADFYMVKFLPDGCVFHRNATLADGADCCDFLYTYE